MQRSRLQNVGHKSCRIYGYGIVKDLLSVLVHGTKEGWISWKKSKMLSTTCYKEEIMVSSVLFFLDIILGSDAILQCIKFWSEK